MDPVTATSDLVLAAQAGDHRAFTQLLEQSDERMRRLAFRLVGSRTAMDDALQDAYLKAYRRIGAYRGDAAFATWLYAVVYRTCLDHLRARRRRREVDLELVDHTLIAGGTAADPAERADDADALAAALATLPTDQVAVVLLVDKDGLSYADTAAILGVREGTIASRLNRAHTTLRRSLDTEGGAS